MKHLCLCPNNSCRSSRAPHPAHLPNRILPTPRRFAVAPGAMLAFSEQAKPPITRPWPSWATHLEVTDLKMEESWRYNTFERRLGNRRFPPKARTVAPRSGAGLRGVAPTRFLGSFFAARQRMNIPTAHRAREAGRGCRRRRVKFMLT